MRNTEHTWRSVCQMRDWGPVGGCYREYSNREMVEGERVVCLRCTGEFKGVNGKVYIKIKGMRQLGF